jgi:CRISPR-associated endonuclease/helicase Cas3
MSLIDDSDDTLVSLLKQKLSDGGCAVVIRNTVSRAQHTYEVLSNALEAEVSLAHSRFLAFDRARIDHDLLERYGKRSDPASRTGVVVATQVVEQSLDVDFDVMITDLAPIDLILQRAGRLHRHNRGKGESERPVPVRNAQMFITAVNEEPENELPAFEGGAKKIYSEYLLLSSLAVLGISGGEPATVTIPHDIPNLVQTVYSKQYSGPKEWQSGISAARKQLEQRIAQSESAASFYRIFNPDEPASPFDLQYWLDNNLQDPDSISTNPSDHAARASVREGDDSFETLVLQKDSEGNIAFPAWGDFSGVDPLPNGFGTPDDEQARAILSCAITLSATSLAYLGLDACIGAIESAVPDQWRQWEQVSKKLSGQLLILLDENGEAQLELPSTPQRRHITLEIKYSSKKGWEVHKVE